MKKRIDKIDDNEQPAAAASLLHADRILAWTGCARTAVRVLRQDSANGVADGDHATPSRRRKSSAFCAPGHDPATKRRCQHLTTALQSAKVVSKVPNQTSFRLLHALNGIEQISNQSSLSPGQIEQRDVIEIFFSQTVINRQHH